jgi:predicted metal-dependent hydrolase
MTMDRERIRIIQEERKSLAMKVTPDGLEVWIPTSLEPEDARVQAFVQDGLRKLPEVQPLPRAEWQTSAQLQELVEAWAQRLDVEVPQVQLRAMRRKWASISTKGTLTLACDLLQLPQDLLDYVVCHELLHLRIPSHNRAFHAMLSAYVPDWQERELRLAAWVQVQHARERAPDL